MSLVVETSLDQISRSYHIPKDKITALVFPLDINAKSVDVYGSKAVARYYEQTAHKVNYFEFSDLREEITGRLTMRQAHRFNIDEPEGHDAGRVIISYARCK
jgi:hypothetical protein